MNLLEIKNSSTNLSADCLAKTSFGGVSGQSDRYLQNHYLIIIPIISSETRANEFSPGKKKLPGLARCVPSLAMPAATSPSAVAVLVVRRWKARSRECAWIRSNTPAMQSIMALPETNLLLMVQKSCVHQLRLVVEIPLFTRYFYIQKVLGLGISGCHQQFAPETPGFFVSDEWNLFFRTRPSWLALRTVFLLLGSVVKTCQNIHFTKFEASEKTM